MNAQPKGVRGKISEGRLAETCYAGRAGAQPYPPRAQERFPRAFGEDADTPIRRSRRHVSSPASDRAGSSDPEVSETKFLHGFRVE